MKIEVDASSQFDSDVDAKGKGKRGTEEKGGLLSISHDFGYPFT